jgi:N-acetylmuramoyl-L-alanine amidase
MTIKTTARIARPLRALIAAEYLLMIVLVSLTCFFVDTRASASADPGAGVIVVDAGHGGIDGGANRGALLEKDITLDLVLKLKTLLERRGYSVVLTRDSDVSLDNLNRSSGSRHERDLIARADIVNASNALLFLSIHVNSMGDDPAENGSVVFFGSKFPQSKILALYIQGELNKVTAGGESRKPHAPMHGRYYLLSCTGIPGVIVETAFISNARERALLTSEEFLGQLAEAIAAGTEKYLTEE